MNERHELIHCTEIQYAIWTEGPQAAPAAHLETCSACREQSRRAADLGAALAGLRRREAMVPLELEASILDAVSQTRLDRARGVVSHPNFWKGAAVAGAAAATAVAGLLVARRLSRADAGEPAEEPEELVA
jgi:predicted anti-sigma-YlaC factor YlaD